MTSVIVKWKQSSIDIKLGKLNGNVLWYQPITFAYWDYLCSNVSVNCFPSRWPFSLIWFHDTPHWCSLMVRSHYNPTCCCMSIRKHFQWPTTATNTYGFWRIVWQTSWTAHFRSIWIMSQNTNSTKRPNNEQCCCFEDNTMTETNSIDFTLLSHWIKCLTYMDSA